MNNKGQTVLSEYVMIFFVVVAALVAMTTFVQRSLEARVHDTRNYMIDTVINSGACDANCLQAAGGKISHEYEPYYAFMLSSSNQIDDEHLGTTAGSANFIGVVYEKSINQQTHTQSISVQLPPCEAQNPASPGCGNAAGGG